MQAMALNFISGLVPKRAFSLANSVFVKTKVLAVNLYQVSTAQSKLPIVCYRDRLNYPTCTAMSRAYLQ